MKQTAINQLKYYLRNCKKFAEFLNDFDYYGKMNKDDVINFLYPTSVSIQVLGTAALRSTLPNTCEFDTLQNHHPLH